MSFPIVLPGVEEGDRPETVPKSVQSDPGCVYERVLHLFTVTDLLPSLFWLACLLMHANTTTVFATSGSTSCLLSTPSALVFYPTPDNSLLQPKHLFV